MEIEWLGNATNNVFGHIDNVYSTQSGSQIIQCDDMCLLASSLVFNVSKWRSAIYQLSMYR